MLLWIENCQQCSGGGTIEGLSEVLISTFLGQSTHTVAIGWRLLSAITAGRFATLSLAQAPDGLMQNVSSSKTPVYLWLQYIAIAILSIGLLSAGALWLSAKEESTAVGYEITARGSYAINEGDNKSREDFELERIGGKSAVLAVHFNRWLTSWFHGKRLAELIAAFSCLIAGFCWRESKWLRWNDKDALIESAHNEATLSTRLSGTFEESKRED